MNSPSPTVKVSDAELRFSDLRHANEARQEFWGGADNWTLADWSNAAAGEVGEACNVVKKIRRVELGTTGNKETLDAYWPKLCAEIGDAVIYLDILAKKAGATLEQCVAGAFNGKSEELNMPVRLERRASGQVEGWDRNDLAEGLALLENADFGPQHFDMADELLAHLSLCTSTNPDSRAYSGNRADFYAVWNGRTHIGTWQDLATASEVAADPDYSEASIVPLYRHPSPSPAHEVGFDPHMEAISHGGYPLDDAPSPPPEIEDLKRALEFYRDGFEFITNKRYGGLEWKPTEALLDDCGNTARAVIAALEEAHRGE